MSKEYISPRRLSTFFNGLKNLFATKIEVSETNQELTNRIDNIEQTVPTIEVVQEITGAIVTTTDKNGTTEAFIANGKSGVHVGTEEPMDNSNVWINPEGKESSLVGKSAYEIALDHGFEGSEEEWLASLVGNPGIQGEKGDKGDKGDKPVAGVDYFTDTDKIEIVEAVAIESVAKYQGTANIGKILMVGTDGNLTLTDMPEGGGVSGDIIGTLDESNNILLTGELADGTYTLRYENADGTYTDIGTLEVGSIPEPVVIVNWLPISTDSSGAIYNKVGYKSGVRLKSDGITESTDIGYNKTCMLTGYIPVISGDVIRTKNIIMGDGGGTGYLSYLWLYNASFAKVSSYNYTTNWNYTLTDGIYTFTVPSDVTGVAYMRIQAHTIDATSIITKNQEFDE